MASLEPRKKATVPPPPKAPLSPSAARLELLNERAANVGRTVLLTEEEEARVAALLALPDDGDGDGDAAGAATKTSGDGATAAAASAIAAVFGPAFAFGGEDAVRGNAIDDELRAFGADESRARTRLVFSEKRNAFVLVDGSEGAGAGQDSPRSPAEKKKKRKKKKKKRNGTRDTRDAGGGETKARTPTHESPDVLADMREKRLAKIKEQQIDDALLALQQAPLARVDGRPGDGRPTPVRAPLSIRAIVQTAVTQGDIAREVEAAREELRIPHSDGSAGVGGDGRASSAALAAERELMATQQEIEALLAEVAPRVPTPQRVERSPPPSALLSSSSSYASPLPSSPDTGRRSSSPRASGSMSPDGPRVINVRPGPNSGHSSSTASLLSPSGSSVGSLSEQTRSLTRQHRSSSSRSGQRPSSRSSSRSGSRSGRRAESRSVGESNESEDSMFAWKVVSTAEPHPRRSRKSRRAGRSLRR